LSNVKQIMLAGMSYAQDYDETLPLSSVDLNADATADYTWRSEVLPYAKNGQIFQCPSKKMTNSPFSGGNDYGQTGGYGVNVFHWAAGNPVPPPGQALGSIQYPSQCVWMAELDDTGGGAAFGNDSDGTNGHGFIYSDAGAKRHNDGCNWGFMDGHAKWYKPAAVKCSTGDCWFSVSGA
jgi:prepilin-type processing-associated H-X9-DG protein